MTALISRAVRRYPDRKLLIKPSTAAIRRIRDRPAAEMRILRGGNARAVTATLSPVIRGRAACYRGVVSCKTPGPPGGYPRTLSHKRATWRHDNKPKRWIAGRHPGKFSTFRTGHRVPGDRDSGACRVKFSRTAIRRHAPAKGAASPDDPAPARYRAGRRTTIKPPLDSPTLRLLTRQDGISPLCRDPLIPAGQRPRSPGQREQWRLHATRNAIAASYLTRHGRPAPRHDDQTRLIHASCQRELQARQRRKPEQQPQPATPSRLA